MKVYRLSDYGKALTAETFRFLGGRLSFSMWASADIRGTDAAKRLSRRDETLTLGDIADKSVLAEREMARWAVERMNMPEFAVVEYDNA